MAAAYPRRETFQVTTCYLLAIDLGGRPNPPCNNLLLGRFGSSSGRAFHTVEAEGSREPECRAFELLVQIAAHGGLPCEALDLQHAARTVGLQVGAADEAVADEERQDIVAVDALGLALVDLDHVLEAEEAAQERAIPDEVVERTDEDGHGRRSVELRSGGDDDRWAAIVDLDAPDEAVAHERLDVRPDFARAAADAAVLGDPGFRQRAPRVHRAQREAATELGARRRRRVEVALRDHALGQLVQALEALPAGDRHLAGREQVLECALRGLPAPHRLAAALERTRRKWSLGRDAREHLALDGAKLRAPLASPPVPVAQVAHTALVERVVLDRDETGLVRPVFEDATFGEQTRELRLVVGADA